MTLDRDGPPIILIQRRRGFVIYTALFWAVALGFGWRFREAIFSADAWRRLTFVALLTMLVAAGLRQAIGVLRPGILVIACEGLQFNSLSGRRSWRWAEVGEFEINSDAEGSDTIRFGLLTAGPSERKARPIELPGGWGVSLPIVCEMLNEARRSCR